MSFKVGDHVLYFPNDSSNTNASGIIQRIKSDAPRYVIENDETGREFAYDYENVIEKIDEENVSDYVEIVLSDDEDIANHDNTCYNDDTISYNENNTGYNATDPSSKEDSIEYENEFDEKEYIK